MINFYRGTLGVPLVCDKRNGAKRSVKLGRFRCQRQRNGAKRTIKYKEVPLPLAAEWWGDSLKKRSRRAAASPPPACSLSSSADAPFRSLASGISIFSSFLPYTVHHSAIRVSVERNPIFPLFPLCATHHSARRRAESQSFPLFYPIRFTIPRKRVSVERELWFARPPPCGANSTAQTPRSAISPARRCCRQNKTRRSNPRGGRSRRWQIG